MARHLCKYIIIGSFFLQRPSHFHSFFFLLIFVLQLTHFPNLYQAHLCYCLTYVITGLVKETFVAPPLSVIASYTWCWVISGVSLKFLTTKSPLIEKSLSEETVPCDKVSTTTTLIFTKLFSRSNHVVIEDIQQILISIKYIKSFIICPYALKVTK